MGGEEKETASQELEPAHVAAEDVEVEKKAEDEAPVPIAPLSSLWMHADTTDQVLLVVAVLGSVAGGVCVERGPPCGQRRAHRDRVAASCPCFPSSSAPSSTSWAPRPPSRPCQALSTT